MYQNFSVFAEVVAFQGLVKSINNLVILKIKVGGVGRNVLLSGTLTNYCVLQNGTGGDFNYLTKH